MMRFWRRDQELPQLEAELRDARREAPEEFIRRLVAHEREPRWLRPRFRVVVAVALGALALAAMASAGGVGVVKEGTKAAWHVVERTTHTSTPRRVVASAAQSQYEKSCGGPTDPHNCKITIFDASVREPRTGTTVMTFTVSLDAPAGAPVTVNFFTSDVSATGGATCGPGVDYISTAGVLTFTAGEQSKTISVTVCSDTISGEGDETFFVNLCCQSGNAEIIRTRAAGVILRG
jgi:Calx-beta domain